jgi:hypothetical protein
LEFFLIAYSRYQNDLVDNHIVSDGTPSETRSSLYRVRCVLEYGAFLINL